MYPNQSRQLEAKRLTATSTRTNFTDEAARGRLRRRDKRPEVKTARAVRKQKLHKETGCL